MNWILEQIFVFLTTKGFQGQLPFFSTIRKRFHHNDQGSPHFELHPLLTFEAILCPRKTHQIFSVSNGKPNKSISLQKIVITVLTLFANY